jgi:probable HAF family extracellular repeat protein
MQALPGLDANTTYAYGVNFDGSIIVGVAGVGHAVLWRNGVPVDLGTLPGGPTNARCVSDDGSVVAGFSYTFPQQAVAWTPTTGMVPLADYLTAHGVTIPAGWTLTDCMAISADGTTFAGLASSGALRQGYIVSVPSPSPLVLGMSSLLVAFRRPSRKAACP